MRRFFFVMVFFLSQPIYADIQWSPVRSIANINPGGNGGDGTLIVLDSYSFSSPTCLHKNAAFISANDSDYSAMLNVVLAAKLAGKQIKVFYKGCEKNYPKIEEISLE